MFGRRPPALFVLPGRSETHHHSHRTEHHEHRAPTDESVKLLKEMEEAADKRRILAVKIEDNHFKAVVAVTRDAMLMGAERAVCRVTLNGKELMVEAEGSAFAQPGHDARLELATSLRDKLAERIASEIIAGSIGRAFQP